MKRCCCCVTGLTPGCSSPDRYAHLDTEIESIFGNIWADATTLRQLWSVYWNRPTAKLLKDGVYRPIMRAGGNRHVASMLVFAVSGAGHTFALTCFGAPVASQLSMLGFFVLQLPLVYLEGALKLRGAAWTFGALALLSPLFVHPLLEAMHLA